MTNDDNNDYINYLLFLFADLHILAKSIIKTIDKDDFIILIGDTPSYLTFFLDKHKHFILPMSNKPFGIIDPPLSEIPKKINYNIKKIFIPTKEQLLTYFEYLNTKTILTKKFVKDNWSKIILIDTSSGASIHGVSIFLNLYVSNLQIKNDKKCENTVDIKNYDTAKPLQFINLISGYSKSFNLDPNLIKNNYGRGIRNFNPKLIIQIACKSFFHRELFTIYELFPRIVEFYNIKLWNKEPETKLSKQIIGIKKIFTILSKGLKKKNLTKKENTEYMEIIKFLSRNIKSVYKDKYIKNNKYNEYINNHNFITDNYKDTMKNILNFILNNYL
jgi:hypothetical protein